MSRIFIVHRVSDKYECVYNIFNDKHEAINAALRGEQANDGWSYIVKEYKYRDGYSLQIREHSLVNKHVTDWAVIANKT